MTSHIHTHEHDHSCRSPRSRRQLWLARASAAAALGLLAAGAGSAYAADGTPTPATGGTPYGGFTSAATATPLRIEIFEPAIPVPASPQAELNFSYSTVSGSSGPTTTALASAMWPGNAVGNGLPAIFANVGLPAHLLGNGYPVRADAQYPGSPSSASQEFLPGMVGRVSGSATKTVARSGYSTSGQVAGDNSGGTGGSDTTSLLTQLQSGNLGALGGLLNGPGSDSNTSSNPLGLLSALVSVGGMSSSSVTDYSDPSVVTATGTSQVGDIDLLGGIVKLEGVTVSSASSSALDAGGKATQKVTYGGMTIAGTPFKLTSDGIEATGSTTAIPGLPDAPAAALKTLGISIDLPKPTKTVSGSQVTAEADGPTITIDTQPVMSLLSLNKLPLGDLLNQLPSSADQLKGLVQAVLTAHPKIVVTLGKATSSVQTIAPIAPPSSGSSTPPPADTGSTGGGGTTKGSGGGSSVGSAPGSTTPPPATGGGTTTPPVVQAAADLSNLPPLGSIPVLLTLGGLILAGGAAWFFRAAALSALGAGGTCSHGLVTGLPDLRKA